MINSNTDLKPASEFIRENAPERFIYKMDTEKHEIALSTHDLQVFYGHLNLHLHFDIFFL